MWNGWLAQVFHRWHCDVKLKNDAKCSLCFCFGDAMASCCVSVTQGWGQLANLTRAVHVGACREVQKALSRARSLFDRWEELLQDGTQVSSYKPHNYTPWAAHLQHIHPAISAIVSHLITIYSLIKSDVINANSKSETHHTTKIKPLNTDWISPLL